MTNKPTELVVTQALLPCPFCGKRAIIETFPSGLKQVSCSDDDASSCLAAITWGSFATEAEAIAAWNTRYRNSDIASTAPASEDEVERVARALYGCERNRSERADAIISAAAGKTISVGMEPWEECWQVFHDDARAAIAALRPRSERESD